MARIVVIDAGLDRRGGSRGVGRDAHTIGRWAVAFTEGGPSALVFEQTGGSPTLDGEQQAELKAAVQESPSQVGIDLSN